MTKSAKVRPAKIISIITAMVSFAMFVYCDLESLTIWTTNIWDCIADTGSLYNFYQYTALNLNGVMHTYCGGGILIYLPWAIWNIPIWILQRFTQVSIMDAKILLLYSKTFLVIIYALIIVLSKKIMKLLAIEDTDDLFVYLMISSLFSITAVCYSGQNDVLVILSFMAGLYFLIKEQGNSKGMWLFILFSSISIVFKPFFCFAFVLIILLYEKNIARVIAKISAGIIPYVLQTMVFWNAPMYREAMIQSSGNKEFESFFVLQIQTMPTPVSVFCLCFCIMCLWAYFYEAGNADRDVMTIYFTLASFLLMFLTTKVSHYRYVYLVPFFFILFFRNAKMRWLNLFLEIVLTMSVIYYFFTYDAWYYNPIFMNLPKTHDTMYSLVDCLRGTGLYGLIPPHIFSNVFYVVSLAGMAVINYPKFKYSNGLTGKEPTWKMYLLRSLLYALPMAAAHGLYILQM